MSEHVCINKHLRDDELQSVLSKLETTKDKDAFSLVCKRWLYIQSTERKKLCVGGGPHMLHKMAARFSRIIDLDLSQSASRSFYPGVTDSDLTVIATDFTGLRILNLQNCKGITDAGMSAIGSSLSSLQSLDVSYCSKLTDTGLSAITKGCHDLKILHLASCRLVTDRLLESLSINCHKLEELGLHGCTNITDTGLTALVSGCKRIKHLDVNRCINVGDLGISTIAEAYSTSLKTLKLQDCYRLGDKSIYSVANFCKNLETLIIAGCRDLSSNSIRSLAASIQNLKILKMDFCLNVSDSSLNAILSKCTCLEVLDIGRCAEVTDAAFQGLGNLNNGNGLGLKVLKITNCPKITVLGISMVLKACRSLEYLDVRSCPRITKAHCEEAGLTFPESCKIRIQDQNQNRRSFDELTAMVDTLFKSFDGLRYEVLVIQDAITKMTESNTNIISLLQHILLAKQTQTQAETSFLRCKLHLLQSQIQTLLNNALLAPAISFPDIVKTFFFAAVTTSIESLQHTIISNHLELRKEQQWTRQHLESKAGRAAPPVYGDDTREEQENNGKL